jgi:PadR family transcriptional regulator, regulatory protein PadR
MTARYLDLPQGTLDLLILRTLALGPQHGWAISERVQQLSSDLHGFSKASSIRHFTAWSVEAWLKLAGERRKTTAVANTTSFRRAGVSNSKWRRMLGRD